MTTQQTESIWNKGTLVHFSCSIYGGKLKLDSDAIQDIDPAFATAYKYLIDREAIKPIEKTRNYAKSYLAHKALQFPIKGVLFVPKGMIPDIDEKMQSFKDTFNQKVEIFAQKFSKLAEDAESHLGPHYDASDYPSNIRNKFGFHWSFMEMSAPGESSAISPELIKREQDKYRKTMSEFQVSAMDTLRKTFGEMIERLTERLQGKKKTFKDTTVDNLREFLNDFEKLNITDDTEMASLIKKAKKVMKGDFSAQDLRDDEDLREQIGKQMGEVQKTMIESLTDKPRRKLMI